MFFRPGALLYVGAVASTEIHAHHAYQLMVSYAEPFELVAPPRRRVSAVSLVVPADASHAIRCAGASAAILFIERDSLAGHRLRSLALDPQRMRTWVESGAPLAALRDEGPPRTWREASRLSTVALEAVAGPSAHVAGHHSAVRRVIAYVGRHLDRRLRVGELAVVAGVSEGYLSHLFSREVGVPLRSYLRWRRLGRAAQALAGGASLTEAAHEAGFADSSHLSHVFRGTFGVAPSVVTRGAVWVGQPQEDSRILQAHRDGAS